MTKVRKVKRRKTYKVSINRKRLRNKLRKLPDITCPQVKAAWDNKKSTRMNLIQMGLSYDPNKSLKIPNAEKEIVKNAKQTTSGGFVVTNVNNKKQNRVAKKIEVALALEENAKAPRESMFRLPNGQVQFLTYLMDKYGDDYEAMARDKKNYYQLTWRQIRSKINTFKGIPEQYAEYLVKKGEIVLENNESIE
ncbi:hypothetical protein PV327_009931 [Microctonus hyperodae]|uniref:Nucleolar protein 16 n=1 Tax=Microctonus hyperodae TaxID=165561 RepID=A0AA39F201_MICHY|nr:hypothetical protein PV327_009931 [Microctonus hyperodae]